MTMRILPVALVATAALGLAACGGSDHRQAAMPGTPANPLQGQEQLAGVPAGTGTRPGTADDGRVEHKGAIGGNSPVNNPKQATKQAPRSNEGASVGTPTPGTDVGYEALVAKQSSAPQERFTPCSLVSQKRAQAILGVRVQQPLEAAQGPTCLYRTTRTRGMVTIAVQQQRFAALAKGVKRGQRLDVGGRRAVCGMLGRPTVIVSLSGGRVLNVNAPSPCTLGKKFAAEAVQHID